ncbi:cadherin-23 [Kryptolebias marmoratus]|uniref:cadherin-23 n=1 Tax=Kryptolebias marmoratus TaxID=37003 RepID=UPI0007F898AC|nr:cadherin-23 [Kryptolebias marmoratus]
MDVGGLSQICAVLVVSVCVHGIIGSPVGTTTIECGGNPPEIVVGSVEEGFSGDVELLTNIDPSNTVTLVSYAFSEHIEFLELIYSPGDTNATVRTKKPLDAEILASTDNFLFYAVECFKQYGYDNKRKLKVNDINDNSPVFEKKHYVFTASETLRVNSEPFRVMAVDADSTPENNRLTYSYEPKTDFFSLLNTGSFQLIRQLNYNVVPKFNFVVSARDKDGNNDTTSVEVTVLDFDNLNPYFSHTLYQAFIPENQGGEFRSIRPEAIKAQDGDFGINMTVTYGITSVIPEKYQNNFDINSVSGVVSVKAAIDREEMTSSFISVNIKAAQTDDSLKTADAVVSVTVEDVNDNPPEFDQSDYSVSLLENSPIDSVLFKPAVTDLDLGGFVGTLRILPESSPFTISSDGSVTVKNSTALDREATETIVFQIEAKEEESPNRVATAEVTVTLLDENDNSPMFTSSKYEGKVFANQTEGMLLLQVKAEDPDDGVNAKVKYSIDFGNNEGYFSLDEDTGEISLVKIIRLEENRVLEFPLYIIARDGGVISRSASAHVTIRAPGNSNPQFLQNVYQCTVEEEQEPGVMLLHLKFVALPTDTLTFNVESEADKFSISSIGELSTRVKLDSDEGPHNYSVRVSITNGVTSDIAVVEVQVTDINDNSPVFASNSETKSVPEDTEIGSNITTLSATDKDNGFNKEIRYSLRGGEGRFSIDPVSGMVSLAAELDRETTAEYNLLVVAEDQGRPAKSATASLLVQVSDINDNIPKFSEAEYHVEVLETKAVDSDLLTLSAVDPDEGANGRITYSIFQQSPLTEPAVFELDSTSGILRLVQPLDYSEVNVYTLRVQAFDGGSPSLTGNSSVVVKVKDVNNNPPEFSKEIYNASVSENLASGASILSLEVTDRDEGGFSNGHFLFTSDTFDINKQGVVSLKKNAILDRETQDRYMLQVVAVDQDPDGLSATAQINITVLDYNDNSPQFPNIPDPLLINEGDYSEEVPGIIFTIVPTDADIGPNGEVTLLLASPHPLFTFRKDGMLLAVGPLDRESRETYELIVRASDKGSPQRENVTTIRVSLVDVNDNSPEFSSSSYVSSILLKDAAEGKLLLMLSATDPDKGNNSLIRYSFSAGNSPYLALNSETGAVTLTSDLANVTEDTTLVLTAVATDHGSPPLNSTARVVVNLRVVSLVEGVAFRESSYNFNLTENKPKGEIVGTVTASSGSNLYSVSYSLKTHTDLFSIIDNGTILTLAKLDKEQQQWYILDVEAVDTRTPPTTATAMVRVQVENVNEPPEFSQKEYEASVFSIAPYKTPVIQVKASDPDVGENSQLVYSLTADGSSFDIDPASGLVYVVSAGGLEGETVHLEVKATDPGQLFATATVKVEVRGSASFSDVTTISLNQPANIVEKKVPELEKSLGKVLKWTVNIIQVSSSNEGPTDSRTARGSVKTLVSFVAIKDGEAVSSEEVTKKLQSESETVKEELLRIFGEELHFDIVIQPQSSTSDQAAVIALGVLCGLSILGLIVSVVVIVRFKMNKKDGSDTESFNLGQKSEDYTNFSKRNSEIVPQTNKGARGFTAEEQQTTNKGTAGRSNRESEERASIDEDNYKF